MDPSCVYLVLKGVLVNSLRNKTFWQEMIDLAESEVRTVTDTTDIAKKSFPEYRIRCVTQNLRKRSPNTGMLMNLRHSHGIFAETIWISVDHYHSTGASRFSHRIELRRFDLEDGHWEGWLFRDKATRDDQALSVYPRDKNMSLEMGLQLIHQTQQPEAPRTLHRNKRHDEQR